MTNIEKLQHDVEIAQKQLEEATKSLEMAKKKLSKISLKVPEMGDNYYTGYSGTLQCCESVHYTAAFDSVSQPQQSAFQEALCVMAEMRVQDGIVVPFEQPSPYYSISLEIYDRLSIDSWYNSTGTSLFPAFESKDAAQTAINAVGEHRLIDCIKTMMFMTPESRGEV